MVASFFSSSQCSELLYFCWQYSRWRWSSWIYCQACWKHWVWGHRSVLQEMESAVVAARKRSCFLQALVILESASHTIFLVLMMVSAYHSVEVRTDCFTIFLLMLDSNPLSFFFFLYHHVQLGTRRYISTSKYTNSIGVYTILQLSTQHQRNPSTMQTLKKTQ